MRQKLKDEPLWQHYGLAKTREVVNQFSKDYEFRISQTTNKNYRRELYSFFKFAKTNYCEVKTKDIRAWVVALGEQNYAIPSITYKVMALKSFFKYCLEEGLIPLNPLDNINLSRMKKFQRRKVKSVDRLTMKRLLELPKDNLLEKAILSTFHATGIRLSELISIRLEDVDLEQRQILIRKGKGQKDRMVPITTECAERIKEYLATQERSHLFCLPRKPLSSNWLDAKFRRYSEILEADSPITPHTMRFSLATYLASQEMPLEYIQEILGHEDIETTRYYAELSTMDQKRIYDYYE